MNANNFNSSVRPPDPIKWPEIIATEVISKHVGTAISHCGDTCYDLCSHKHSICYEVLMVSDENSKTCGCPYTRIESILEKHSIGAAIFDRVPVAKSWRRGYSCTVSLGLGARENILFNNIDLQDSVKELLNMGESCVFDEEYLGITRFFWHPCDQEYIAMAPPLGFEGADADKELRQLYRRRQVNEHYAKLTSKDLGFSKRALVLLPTYYATPGLSGGLLDLAEATSPTQVFPKLDELWIIAKDEPNVTLWRKDKGWEIFRHEKRPTTDYMREAKQC